MASPNPALPSPPRDGDRNRGSSILVTESIFLAIATILFLARLYVRSRIPIGLGLDDLSVGLGLVSGPPLLPLISHNTEQYQTGLCYRSPRHRHHHGTLWRRASSILPRALATAAIELIASLKMAIHI